MPPFEQLGELLKRGRALPGTNYKVKGFGQSHGEPALIYFIPNKNDPGKPSQKAIAKSSFDQAYQQLADTGEFSRKWFETNIEAKGAPCNFRAIGAVFVLLDIASYARGKYVSSS